MNNNKSYNTIYLVTGIILIGIISRLIPNNLPNFSAVGAVALFAGNYLKSNDLKYIIPISAMFIGDILLSFYNVGLASPLVHFSVYYSFILIVFIGSLKFKRKSKLFSVTVTSLIASLIFFIITNFAVWLGGAYGYTLNGLLTCYTAAIPFFGNTILGNLTYCAILFGAYEYIKLKTPKLVAK